MTLLRLLLLHDQQRKGKNADISGVTKPSWFFFPSVWSAIFRYLFTPASLSSFRHDHHLRGMPSLQCATLAK